MIRTLSAAATAVVFASAVHAGPLHDVVKDGDLVQVKQEIAKSEDVNADNFMLGMPLHFAAREGHIAMADLLLANGVDVNAKVPGGGGELPLHFAAKNGQKDAVRLLLAKGADLNAKGFAGKTALDTAVNRGREEIADIPRAAGATE